MTNDRLQYGMLLAVLPKYRQKCIEMLVSELDDDLSIQVSAAHLDPSVRTGIEPNLYNQCPMIRFKGKCFLQIPMSFMPWRVANLVLDLNPRSLMAWVVLISRRLMGRRTLVWGHVHPQAGGSARTAFLRASMRRLSDGTISYTHKDRLAAIREIPGKPVWVAPNSIYSRAEIKPAENISADRNSVIYVGRFQPQKKVQLLVQGFAAARNQHPEMRLILVGGGSEEDAIKSLVRELKIENFVKFAGWIDEVSELSVLYGSAFASASPGFAGLGLTQSLGFGIPMAVAEDESHSPEIELAEIAPVTWFDSDDPNSLAGALRELWESKELVPMVWVSDLVRNRYSAESMAEGLASALLGDE